MKVERKWLKLLELPTDHARPATRAECANLPRPCPFYSCRYHIVTEVKKSGALVEHPDASESCALDCVDREPDGMTLQAVADAFGLTRQRIEQIEKAALAKLAALPEDFDRVTESIEDRTRAWGRHRPERP